MAGLVSPLKATRKIRPLPTWDDQQWDWRKQWRPWNTRLKATVLELQATPWQPQSSLLAFLHSIWRIVPKELKMRECRPPFEGNWRWPCNPSASTVETWRSPTASAASKKVWNRWEQKVQMTISHAVLLNSDSVSDAFGRRSKSFMIFFTKELLASSIPRWWPEADIPCKDEVHWGHQKHQSSCKQLVIVNAWHGHPPTRASAASAAPEGSKVWISPWIAPGPKTPSMIRERNTSWQKVSRSTWPPQKSRLGQGHYGA